MPPVQTTRDLALRFKRLLDTKESRRANFPAILGNDAGDVWVTGHPGFVHLHSPDGQYLGIALNNSVPPNWGTRVLVGESQTQRGIWQVLSVQETGVTTTDRGWSPNVAPHNVLTLAHDADPTAVPVEHNLIVRNGDDQWTSDMLSADSFGTDLTAWYNAFNSWYQSTFGGLPPGAGGGGGEPAKNTTWHTFAPFNEVTPTPSGVLIYTVPDYDFVMAFITHVIYYDCSGSDGTITLEWKYGGTLHPAVDLGVLPDGGGGYIVRHVTGESGVTYPPYGDGTNELYICSTSASEYQLEGIVEMTLFIYDELPAP